jgi:hypothetical protein
MYNVELTEFVQMERPKMRKKIQPSTMLAYFGEKILGRRSAIRYMTTVSVFALATLAGTASADGLSPTAATTQSIVKDGSRLPGSYTNSNEQMDYVRLTGGANTDDGHQNSLKSAAQITLAMAGGRATDPLAAVAAAPTAGPPRLAARGSYVYAPDGTSIRLRGWNWGAKESAQPQDAADNVKQGANVVRVPLSWYYGSNGDSGCGGAQDSYDPAAPGFINPASLAALDQQVQWASAAHLWVDVMVRGGDCDFWTNPVVISQYRQMWQFLAQRYANTPYIGAYELLSEPHPPSQFGNNQVRDLYVRVITAVRAIDAETPIIVGNAKDYDIRNLQEVYMPNQSNIIYTANFYELPAYVKQAKVGGSMTGYPGYYMDEGKPSSACDYVGRGQQVFMNKEFLSTLMVCATAFRDRNHAPIFINQIGIRSVTPQSLKYVRDVLGLFALDHIGFTYWDYRTPWAHGSMLDGGAAVIWQNKRGTYFTKTLWLSTISSYFKGR